MRKSKNVRYKLSHDPDGVLYWQDGGQLPRCVYDSQEVKGVRIDLMLDGDSDVYVIMVLPADEYSTYDAWLRRQGSTDMVHMLRRRARDPEDVVVAAKEHLTDYLGLI